MTPEPHDPPSAPSEPSAPSDADPTATTVTAEEERLLERARKVAQRAHAPYSGVQVGAALLDRDGGIHTACNVENVSYGLTICAERAAIARAVSDGHRGFVAIAVHASTARAFPPCGACRQVLAEFAPRLRVVWQGADGRPRGASLRELLPAMLQPGDLVLEPDSDAPGPQSR